MKKRLLLLALFIACALSAKLDESILKQNAAQFGNKTANLMELQKITAGLNAAVNKPDRFTVPAFFGISHDEVLAYLNRLPLPQNPSKMVADYITEQWEEFTKQQPHGSSVLDPEAKVPLAAIRTAVLNAFNPAKGNQFVIQVSTRMQALDHFLMQSGHDNKQLMIRSTGREDSKEFANAGGNESIPAVPPTISDTTKAMGKVIASYFSKKSIGQRLIGAPDKIFDPPFMPVLLQIMIGEEPGRIPTSGVMFSQEAEGPTPGVAAIQATYGHNEGVVTGLVPVDTFYIGPTKIIHPLVRIKTERLKPGAAFKLERTPNPINLQQIPCLNKPALFDLKECANFVQNYYGYPVDIEFVKLNETINLVQTRPIVLQEINPSYLNDRFIQVTPPERQQSITTIGAGGGEVRTILGKQNVIISDTIRQALDIFRDEPNKPGIQAVIIGELAPATSHEATNFRGAGKPVVYFPDLDHIRRLVENAAQSPLLIDVQRELIIPFKPVNEFTNPERAINFGWITHPIPKKTSLFAEFWATITPEERDTLRPARQLDIQEFSQLLAILRKGNPEFILPALKTILYFIQNKILAEIKKHDALRRVKRIDPFYTRQLRHIFAQAISCALEMYKTIDKWKMSAQTSTDRIIWLYPLTFLEAVIRQIPSPKEYVANYSLGALIKSERQEQALLGALGLPTGPLTSYIIQYAKAGEYALTDDVGKDWIMYLQALPLIKDSVLQQNFAQLIYNLVQLDMIPLWLNLSFPQAMQKHPANVENLTKSLLDEYNQSKDFLDQLQVKKKQLDAVAISNWEVPDKFKSMLKSFQDILAYFKHPQFIQTYEQSGMLAKNAAIGVMNQLVNTFDLSIKALEGSRLYTDQKIKTQNFSTLLRNYFDLLNEWASISSIAVDLQQLLDDRTFKTVAEYLQVINKILIKNPKDDPEQLQSSPGFNVAAASLGSKAEWSRSIGNKPTLDDMFTLIHQNLLVVLATLSKQAGLENIKVPPLVAQLKKEVETISIQFQREIRNISLIGITLDNKQLIYYYNLPLQYHSNTFQIIYAIETKETILETKFLGDTLGHGGRWEKLAALTPLVSRLAHLPLKQPPQLDVDRGIFSFRWKIDSIPQARIAIKCLKAFLSMVALAPGPGITEQLSLIITPQNTQQFFDELLKSIPEHPYLILFLPGINLAKGGNPDDPTIKRTFDLLPDIVRNATPQLLTYIFEMIERLTSYGYYALIPEKILEAMLVLVPQANEETLRKIQFRLTSILPKIPYTDSLEKTAQELLQRPGNNEKRIGLAIFSSLAFNNRALPAALKAALTYINDPNPDLANAAFKILVNLAKTPMKYKPDKLAQIINIAVQKRKDPDTAVRQDALNLLDGLVRQGKAIDAALNSALPSLGSDDFSEQQTALRIIGTILEQEASLAEKQTNVIDALVKQSSGDFILQGTISNILSNLLTKRKSLPIAMIILEQLSSKNPDFFESYEEQLLNPLIGMLKDKIYINKIKQIIENLEKTSMAIESAQLDLLRQKMEEIKKSR